MAERDLCANCGRWREQHYNLSGIFTADRQDPPCLEFQGSVASAKRSDRKRDDLKEGWGSGGFEE